MGIRSPRTTPARRGEDEAKISSGLFCRSILRETAHFPTYVNSRTLSKASTSPLGASLVGDSCEFRVWAPAAKTVTLRLMNEHGTHDWPMQYEGDHCFALQAF